MKSIIFTTVLLILSVAVTVFAQEIVFPQGEERELTAEDFFRYTQNDIKYNEIWRYNFVFDNGTKVFLSYSIMSVPFLGTNCGINTSFYNFRGKNYQVGREYPENRFDECKDAPGAIHIRTGSENNVFFMTGLPGDGHHVVFKTHKNEGFLLDLIFSDPLLGKVIGDGVFKLGQQKNGLYVHIPEGHVKGVIGIGEDIMEVEGFGYMEHLRQTKQAMDLAACSVQLYGKDAPFAGNIFVGPEKYAFSPYGYTIDKKTRKVLLPKEIKAGGNKISNKLRTLNGVEIIWRNDPHTATIDNPLEHQRYSLLSTIKGWPARQAARFFMGGELISLRGVSRVNSHPAHFNIFLIK